MIKALNDYAFVELIKEQVTSATGIIIEAPSKLLKAKVLDLSDMYSDSQDIESGIDVYFTKEDYIPLDEKRGFVSYFKIISRETYE